MNIERDTDQAEEEAPPKGPGRHVSRGAVGLAQTEQDHARIKRRAIKGAAHEIASSPGPGRDQLAILPRDNYLALDFVRDNRWI